MSGPFKPRTGIPDTLGAEFKRVTRKKLISLSASANTGMRSVLDIPGRPEDNFTICGWVRINTQSANTIWASQTGAAQLFNGNSGDARYGLRGRHHSNKIADGEIFGQMVWGHVIYQHGLNFQATIDVKMITNGVFQNSHTGGASTTDITTDGFHWFMGDDSTTTTDDGFIGEAFDFCFIDGIIDPDELNYANGKWQDLSEHAKSKCVYRLDGQTSDPGYDSSGANHHFQVEQGGVTLSLDDLPPGANQYELGPIPWLPNLAAGGDITGSGAISTPVPTLSGTGEVETTGSGAINTTIPSLSGAGLITKTGSGAINTTVPTLSGTGEVTKTGSGAINAPVPALSGTGEVSVVGSGAISTPVPTLSASGGIEKTGSGAINTTLPTLSGTGGIEKTGSGAINTPLPTLAGTGSVGDDITGSGAINTTLPTLSGSGGLTKTGSGAINTTLPTLSGAGEITKTGSGAISTPIVTTSGTGNMGRSGSGAITAPVPTLSGSGTVGGVITGSGAISTTIPSLSGTGELTKTGTGAIATPIATLAGTGKITVTGTGAITAPVPTLAGSGLITVTGSGAINLPLPTLSGTAADLGARRFASPANSANTGIVATQMNSVIVSTKFTGGG